MSNVQGNPTYEQITEEVAKLQELRSEIPPRTGFGDDNLAAIDAQVAVMEKGMKPQALYDQFEDDDHVLTYAQEAYDWIIGEGEPPSDGWSELKGVKVKPLKPIRAYTFSEVMAQAAGQPTDEEEGGDWGDNDDDYDEDDEDDE